MTYRRWTEDEFEILDRVYPAQGVRGVQALLPHRSLISIKTMAHFRCIRSANRRPWTAEETAIVVANYRTLGAKRTAAMVPGRDPEDVAAHANMHVVYRFRTEEAA
jgi:hypothetical protein